MKAISSGRQHRGFVPAKVWHPIQAHSGGGFRGRIRFERRVRERGGGYSPQVSDTLLLVAQFVNIQQIHSLLTLDTR